MPFFTVSYKVYGSVRVEADDRDDAIDKFECMVMEKGNVLEDNLQMSDWETTDVDLDS